jgi:EAL domain-containing protein (putative c-di-GMP-specific phosphodiesterase class I)/FixJ family two-component response regulator
MDLASIRILVLDDEPFMHKLLAHMLAELGFSSVATCDNGPAALAWVDAPGQSPELILLDLNMPQMDGIEFVRKLVEHEYKGSLILVSGEAERVLQMTEKLVQAHRIPVLGHLRKPVSVAGLAELVGRWKPAQDALRAAKAYGADELRAAIANDELVNYYQPKVVAASGELVGVETLVRWRHPIDGLIPPDQFIRVAEQNGLIGELTRAVLTAAMTQARAWRQAGVKLRVAVNVSMESLSAVSFADFIAETAQAAGVPPQDIVLELTETGLLPDQRASLEILARLRLKRFRLSIDDFGTGNSSLTQLRDIAFDELKIDRSFVSGAWRDETARAMYDASLGLGKQLDMEVVAEGVEDRDDWDLVRRSGCDLAQGYFIAHPMPAAELEAWMQSWNDRVEELQVSA